MAIVPIKKTQIARTAHRSIHDQRIHLYLRRENLSAFQIGKLDNEADVYFLWIHRFHQFIGSFHRPACCQKIVVQHHNVVFADCIAMQFDRVNSVFFAV